MFTGNFYDRKKMGFLSILFLFFASVQLHAQIPTKCFEIESILVDACVPGGGCVNSLSPACNCEGKNEMVRFKTGPNPINIANISITWPNNSYLGLVQNALTASLCSQLNATIQSCGHLIEPVGGIIPAGKEVLLITSTDMCTTANSFANLSDTLYLIFQNPNNYQGHFANTDNTASITSTPTGASSTRTLIMSYTPTGCGDTVTYDRCLLVNILGSYGGSTAQNDGSTVQFSWPGAPVATYVNYGCQAPFVPLGAAATGGGNICSNGTVNLVGTPTGNFTSVHWSGGSGFFSPANASTTIYTPGASDNGNTVLTFSVIGVCGDTVSTSVSLNVIQAPSAQITAGGPTTFCTGNNVTLTASGGTSYSWNTSATTASITVNTSGIYTVTATNTCGSDTQTIAVNVLPLPVAQITAGGPTTFCSGGNVTLTASGGTTYLWNTSATTAAITVNTSGTYTVTASNTCGSDTETIAVNVLPLPIAQITANGPTTFCPGDSVQLTASGGTSYLWMPGNLTASSIYATTAGTYTVTATNTCGNDTETIAVNVSTTPNAQITASGPTTFCVGNNVTLTASGGTSYVWSNNATTAAITVNTSGTYTVTANTTCGSDTQTISVNVLPLPIATVTANGPTAICQGDSVHLTASGGTSYLWSNGSTSSGISATTAGTYTVAVTNPCGTDTATITVTVTQDTVAAIVGNTLICSGDSAVLVATGGGNYLWSTGATGNSITVFSPGNYFVIASNNCGADTALLNVIVDQVTAGFSSDVTTGIPPLNVNFTNGSSASATNWQWNFGDNSAGDNSTNPSHTFNAAGTYIVVLTVSDSIGCTDTAQETIVVNETASSLSIPNVFTPNGDGTNDAFLIMSTGIHEYDIKIFDRWGILVFESTSPNDAWDGHTTSGMLASDGTYYYILNATGYDKKEYKLSGFLTLIR